METIADGQYQNGCVIVYAIFDHLLNSFEPTRKVLIRSASGVVGESNVSRRVLAEYGYRETKEIVLSSIMPPRRLTMMTGEVEVMPHFVSLFQNVRSGKTDTVLDLSSMQFGDIGRGPGGELFWCGDLWEFSHKTSDQVAKSWELKEVSRKTMEGTEAERIRRQGVAMKIKERYADGPSGFCGYCGAPKPPKKCPC